MFNNFNDKDREFDNTNNYYNTTDNNEMVNFSNGYNQQDFIPIKVVDKKEKTKKHTGKVFLAIALCACISFAASFGGFYAAKEYFADETQTSANTNVIYQTVDRTDSTGASTTDLSVADIADLTKNSVVEIRTEIVQTDGRMGQFVSQGAGSGVIITTDGYIVTNSHVIDGATTITVRLSDEQEYTATLIGQDPQTDLAVLKIEAENLTPAVFGSSSSLRVGENAIVIGNPLGELGGTVTSGIISALDREITIDGETMTLLQTNAAINPGNSGGGLFNSAGELIGIVNAKSSGTDIEGLGFAIPIDTAKTIIEELMKNGYVSGRPSLGVTLIDITDTTTAMRYRVSNLGVYVYESENSALESGDLIQSVNGKVVSSASDIKAIIQSMNIGETLEMIIIRDTTQTTVSVTLKGDN